MSVASYDAVIKLVVQGEEALKRIQDRVDKLYKTINDLESKKKFAGTEAAATFVRKQANELERVLAVSKQIIKQDEQRVIQQSKLNSAVDLYERRLKQTVNSGAAGLKKFEGQIKEIEAAFKFFKDRGNVAAVQALATELGRMVEYSNSVSRNERARAANQSKVFEYVKQINSYEAQGLKVAEARKKLAEFTAVASTNQLNEAKKYADAVERQLRLLREQAAVQKQVAAETNVLQSALAKLEATQRELENNKLDQKALQVQAAFDRQAAAAAESAAQLDKLNARQQEFTARTDAAAQAAARQTAAFVRQQRIAKLTAIAVANVPAGPLMLPAAPAGAPAMGGGARPRITGPVERLGGARTQDQADMALRFAQALKEQVRPLSQIQYLYAGIASQAAKLQTIKALPDTAMLNASARGLQTIESIEDKRIARLERIRQKLQQIAAYEASSGTMANAGFGVQGPAVPPGGVPPKSQGRVPAPAGLGFRAQPGGENLALGLGFPLLFGGGAGQVAGGLLGSFFGEGFGGQILGSAIGQQLEDAQRRIAEIGTALNTLNMDELKKSTVLVTDELENQVRLLQEAGRAEEARAVVAKQVTLQTGLLPETVGDITNNVTLLGNSWNEFLGAVSGTLAIIGTPFISALTVITQGLTKALQGVNIIASGAGIILKRFVELAAKIPFLQPILQFIQDKTKAIAETEKSRLVPLQQLTDGQLRELANNQKLLQIESQRTLGRTIAEKQINLEVDKQLANERIRTEYAEKAKQIRQEYGTITSEVGQRELDLALSMNSALEAQALNQQSIKDKLTEQSLALEINAEQYAQATAAVQTQVAALDRGNQITQARYSAEAALNDLYGAQLTRQYELAATTQERFNIALRMFEQQTRAAQLEYDQTLNNNALLVAKAQIEANLVSLKYKQLEAEKALAVAYAKSRGNTSDQIKSITEAYDKGLGLQKEAVETAYSQVEATKDIASNQNVVADAVYKTKVIQAESQLAQKLVSKEIGMSESAANNLAGRLATGVYRANELAGAMSRVTQQSAQAAQQLQNALNIQNMLRIAAAATPTTTTTTTTTTTAADSVPAYAYGGFVSKPTYALIGEGGQGEYIVPQSKAAGFAANYLSGSRGAAAIPGGGSGNEAAPTINIQTGPVLQQNGQTYVTMQDFEQGLQSVAASLLGNTRSAGGRRYAGVR